MDKEAQGVVTEWLWLWIRNHKVLWQNGYKMDMIMKSRDVVTEWLWHWIRNQEVLWQNRSDHGYEIKWRCDRMVVTLDKESRGVVMEWLWHWMRNHKEINQALCTKKKEPSFFKTFKISTALTCWWGILHLFPFWCGYSLPTLIHYSTFELTML